MEFTAFIDESGEAGIAKVRGNDSPGASPNFVLAAAVFQSAGMIRAESVLKNAKVRIGKKKWAHASDLTHFPKLHLAREFSNVEMRLFAVISHKATLLGYKETIGFDAQKYYNKCLQYLLEKICAYLKGVGAGQAQLNVILEERNHDYDAMIRFLSKVKENPLHPEAKHLDMLNPFAISRMKKGEVAALEIADFVAHAVYQCANKSDANFGIPEFRYVDELSSRFACDNRGLVLGTGIKCIHSIEELDLDLSIQKFLKNIRSKPFTSV